MHRWMLWSRFAALNLFGVAGLVLAYLNGWIDAVLAGDPSRISLFIFVLFLIGLIGAGWRIGKVTREMESVKRGESGRLARYRETLGVGRNATRALELRLFSRITFVRYIANALVLLGLLGTVVGFVMALSGVSAESVADVNAVSGMVTNLIQGMGVALYTTLVGTVLNLWLTANYQLLATGTANLAAALIDAGTGEPAYA